MKRLFMIALALMAFAFTTVNTDNTASVVMLRLMVHCMLLSPV